jgi:hypothetical protein
MSIFQMYLELGFTHIADFNGYDHILFLMSLVAIYTFRDWNKLLKLVTAFTLGHSISLALSALNYIHFSSPIIELLIPITIIITALANIIHKQETSKKFYIYEYIITAIFGLIHGMGFSILLKNLLGEASNIVWPLLAFNIGIELGQIIIVLAILFIGLIITKSFKYPKKDWGLILSSMSLGIASILVIERWIW